MVLKFAIAFLFLVTPLASQDFKQENWSPVNWKKTNALETAPNIDNTTDTQLFNSQTSDNNNTEVHWKKTLERATNNGVLTDAAREIITRHLLQSTNEVFPSFSFGISTKLQKKLKDLNIQKATEAHFASRTERELIIVKNISVAEEIQRFAAELNTNVSNLQYDLNEEGYVKIFLPSIKKSKDLRTGGLYSGQWQKAQSLSNLVNLKKDEQPQPLISYKKRPFGLGDLTTEMKIVMDMFKIQRATQPHFTSRAEKELIISENSNIQKEIIRFAAELNTDVSKLQYDIDEEGNTKVFLPSTYDNKSEDLRINRLYVGQLKKDPFSSSTDTQKMFADEHLQDVPHDGILKTLNNENMLLHIENKDNRTLALMSLIIILLFVLVIIVLVGFCCLWKRSKLMQVMSKPSNDVSLKPLQFQQV